LLWEIVTTLNIVNTIDRTVLGVENVEGPSPGKYFACWCINRAVEPESATQLELWVRTTALPSLCGMVPEDFTKDAFLRSLDAVCHVAKLTDGRIKSYIPKIEDELYQKWRSIHPLPGNISEHVAFDLTAIPTFGNECPLAEPGHKTSETGLNQINLSVLTSRFDSYPISHFVHPGSFPSITTIPSLIVRIKEQNIPPGTLVWDRGYTAKKEIVSVEQEGWKLISGVPKRDIAVKSLIKKTEIPITPDSLVPTDCMNIYAIKIENSIFGLKGSVVLYVNIDRRLHDIKQRNAILSDIQGELKELQGLSDKLDQKIILKKLKSILGENKKFFKVTITSSEHGNSLIWEQDNEARLEAERMDGKCMLYATDPSLTAEQIVKAYFEKDFIEKVFRELKTYEEIGPIRHRLESRVMAIIFVCTLALRLKVVLRTLLLKVKDKKKWTVTVLLKKLQRVERVDLLVGDTKEIWYVNLQQKTCDVLEEIGMGNLLPSRGKVA
jgi:transposase